MYTSATYESTKCLYSGRDWHKSVWGEYVPQVNVYELSADECEKLAKLAEKAARSAADLHDVVTWATFAQNLRESLQEAMKQAQEHSAEAEQKAAENAAAEAAEATETATNEPEVERC